MKQGQITYKALLHSTQADPRTLDRLGIGPLGNPFVSQFVKKAVGLNKKRLLELPPKALSAIKFIS